MASSQIYFHRYSHHCTFHVSCSRASPTLHGSRCATAATRVCVLRVLQRIKEALRNYTRNSIVLNGAKKVELFPEYSSVVIIRPSSLPLTSSSPPPPPPTYPPPSVRCRQLCNNRYGLVLDRIPVVRHSFNSLDLNERVCLLGAGVFGES